MVAVAGAALALSTAAAAVAAGISNSSSSSSMTAVMATSAPSPPPLPPPPSAAVGARSHHAFLRPPSPALPLLFLHAAAAYGSSSISTTTSTTNRHTRRRRTAAAATPNPLLSPAYRGGGSSDAASAAAFRHGLQPPPPPQPPSKSLFARIPLPGVVRRFLAAAGALFAKFGLGMAALFLDGKVRTCVYGDGGGGAMNDWYCLVESSYIRHDDHTQRALEARRRLRAMATGPPSLLDERLQEGGAGECYKSLDAHTCLLAVVTPRQLVDSTLITPRSHNITKIAVLELRREYRLVLETLRAFWQLLPLIIIWIPPIIGFLPPILFCLFPRAVLFVCFFFVLFFFFNGCCPTQSIIATHKHAYTPLNDDRGALHPPLPQRGGP